MKAAIKKKWLKALRSGEYTQDNMALKNEYGHCCLGVLCETIKDEFPHAQNLLDGNGSLDNMTLKFCGIPDKKQGILIRMNDDHKMSFKQIAAHIERYL